MSDDAELFDRHRSLLFTLGYELLGSVADAEDVVQEAWLRWSQRPVGEVVNPRAYLAQIVTRLALNRLRTLARRREDYVGPWLPDPLLTAPDVAEDVVLAESVSLALLVVLESLGPANGRCSCCARSSATAMTRSPPRWTARRPRCASSPTGPGSMSTSGVPGSRPTRPPQDGSAPSSNAVC